MQKRGNKGGRKLPAIKMPSTKKAVPVAATQAPPPVVGLIRFRFHMLDIGGPYCLSSITAHDHAELLTFLKAVEKMTVHELFAQQAGKPKDYPLDEIPTRRAVERLHELGYDEYDQISNLRVTGAKRLYGFRQDNEFAILWWDPEHEIWPSTKK